MSVRVKLHNELATTAAPTVEDGINPKPVWAIRFSWLKADQHRRFASVAGTATAASIASAITEFMGRRS
jgi:hypothetical protein